MITRRDLTIEDFPKLKRLFDSANNGKYLEFVEAGRAFLEKWWERQGVHYGPWFTHHHYVAPDCAIIEDERSSAIFLNAATRYLSRLCWSENILRRLKDVYPNDHPEKVAKNDPSRPRLDRKVGVLSVAVMEERPGPDRPRGLDLGGWPDHVLELISSLDLEVWGKMGMINKAWAASRISSTMLFQIHAQNHRVMTRGQYIWFRAIRVRNSESVESKLDPLDEYTIQSRYRYMLEPFGNIVKRTRNDIITIHTWSGSQIELDMRRRKHLTFSTTVPWSTYTCQHTLKEKSTGKSPGGLTSSLADSDEVDSDEVDSDEVDEVEDQGCDWCHPLAFHLARKVIKKRAHDPDKLPVKLYLELFGKTMHKVGGQYKIIKGVDPLGPIKRVRLAKAIINVATLGVESLIHPGLLLNPQMMKITAPDLDDYPGAGKGLILHALNRGAREDYEADEEEFLKSYYGKNFDFEKPDRPEWWKDSDDEEDSSSSENDGD